MRDPAKKPALDTNQNARHQTSSNMTQEVEPAAGPSSGKTVRVAFGPQSDTYIPPPPVAPTPTIGHHHRSQTVTGVHHSSLPNGAEINQDPKSNYPLQSSQSRPEPSINGRPRPALIRAKSEHWHDLDLDDNVLKNDDEDFQLRHGWQEEYTSSEYLKILNSVSRNAVLSDLPLGGAVLFGRTASDVKFPH